VLEEEVGTERHRVAYRAAKEIAHWHAKGTSRKVERGHFDRAEGAGNGRVGAFRCDAENTLEWIAPLVRRRIQPSRHNLVEHRLVVGITSNNVRPQPLQIFVHRGRKCRLPESGVAIFTNQFHNQAIHVRFMDSWRIPQRGIGNRHRRHYHVSYFHERFPNVVRETSVSSPIRIVSHWRNHGADLAAMACP
jgi:hypothetical protein